MKKHLVFCHQNYPAQFGPVCGHLLKNYDVDITFLSQYITKDLLPGVRHIAYQPMPTGHEDNPYFFARYFEKECANMHGLYGAFMKALTAKQCPDPDIFIAHVGFGTLGLLHTDFQAIPRIGFFELFYDPFKAKEDNRQEYPLPKPNQIRIPLRNATSLVELLYCTKGYSPTPYQRSTFPQEFQHKLTTLFDGVDTNFYQPGTINDNSSLQITWPHDAPIITFVSRGLEAYRGFDYFMEVAHEVSLKNKDVHFVIAGRPQTHYGNEMTVIKDASFKEYVLKQRPYDLNRFHFMDWIPEDALNDLFKLSACHFYWTTPFTLSWSLFQAMSSGCLIMGSNTAPVRDLVQHNQNGLLVDPNNKQMMAEMMLDILGNPQRYQALRVAARETVTSQYGFDTCLPKLAEFYLNN